MLSDHLLIRQAEMLARQWFQRPKPPRSLMTTRALVDARLDRDGLRLVKASKKVRPFLGEYFILELRTQQVRRTHVELLGLARELGIGNHKGGHRNSPRIECGVSTTAEEVV